MKQPLSLHVRLLIVAGVTTVAALLFAFFTIGQVMEDLVRRSVDEKLNTQIEALAHAVSPSGRLDIRQVILLPQFAQDQGWTWEVRSPAGRWDGATKLDETSLRLMGHHHRSNGASSGRGRNDDGEPVYFRQLSLPGSGGGTEIIAASPAAVLDEPIGEALGSIILSLALLGFGLSVATLIQLRFGLRPLRDLQGQVEKVRLGERQNLSLDQPKEIRPLAEEVNALIEQNAKGLEHSRRHLSNLAHGLKTPLATLSVRLAREDGSSESRALVAQLDKRIAHHLRRARSAAVSDGGRSRTLVAPVSADLIDTLRKIHADRALEFAQDVDPKLSVATERQDLEEILGNLIDNAARFARSTVELSARLNGRMVEIAIEDDGIGMPASEITTALRRGGRLDESGVGYGFGLSIAQELAQLYGGDLRLDRSNASGGLRALVTLPSGL